MRWRSLPGSGHFQGEVTVRSRGEGAEITLVMDYEPHNADVEDMVVGVISTSCAGLGCYVWLGAKLQGQTAPSYHSSPVCSLPDPVNLALIGFSGNIIQVVTLESPPVPAIGGLGIALLLLVLLAGSVYFRRRRAPGSVV